MTQPNEADAGLVIEQRHTMEWVDIAVTKGGVFIIDCDSGVEQFRDGIYWEDNFQCNPPDLPLGAYRWHSFDVGGWGEDDAMNFSGGAFARFERDMPRSVGGELADEGEIVEALIKAVLALAARVCERHINLKLCRQLFGDGGPGAFGMARHLADDVYAANYFDDRRIREACAKLRNQPATDAAREALRDLLPSRLCGEEWGLPDDETVSIVVTFGKLKRARAALKGEAQ